MVASQESILGRPPSLRESNMLPIDIGRFRKLSDFETTEGVLRDEWKEKVHVLLNAFGLLHKGIEVPFAPRLPHQDSEADYKAEYRVGKSGENGEEWNEIYVYTLDEGKSTSIHSHPAGTSETLVCVSGTGYQVVDGEARPFEQEPISVISSGIEHQVFANSALLMIAFTHNPNRLPPDKLHNHIKKSGEIFKANGVKAS